MSIKVTPTKPSTTSIVTAGGLVGEVRGAIIKNINTVGEVIGWAYAGGILGRIVNDDPISSATEFSQAISRGKVTSNRNPDRAGTIGSMRGNLMAGSHCSVFFNSETDAGTPFPTNDIACNAGLTAQELTLPHAPPDRLLNPYVVGSVITQAMIDDSDGGLQQCNLASGTDDDWGFGTCGKPFIWKANSTTQFNTLERIPSPSVQPR